MPIVDLLRLHRQRIVCILGMAMVWPSIHNQILYPITFAFHKEGMPSVYMHFLLYSIVMLVVVALIATMNEANLRRTFSSKRVLAITGLTGAVGISLIVACDFSTVLSSALVSVGIALAATFVPTHFTFWSIELLSASKKSVAFDLVVSYLVFCLLAGARIASGLHGWPFAIAFPALSGVLALISLSMPQKNYPASKAHLSDYPQWHIVPAVMFVYVACISIWLLNPYLALSDYPPAQRALMYAAVGALMIALAIMFRPDSKIASRAPLIGSIICIGFLVVSMLVSGIGSHEGFDFGNFPVLAGKIALEMGIWLIMLAHSQKKHLGIVTPSLVYLVFVVGASNVISVSLLLYSQGLAIDRGELPILAISAISAIVVLLVMNVLLAAMLMRKNDLDKERELEAEAPCIAAINATISEDEAIARVVATFKLSAREADTLRLAAKNMSARDMAAELFVAESTVNSHLKSIYRKCDVHSKKELAQLVERFKR